MFAFACWTLRQKIRGVTLMKIFVDATSLSMIELQAMSETIPAIFIHAEAQCKIIRTERINP